ncbi:MAG: hypothetical protein ABSD47_13025 [Candidatus Methylomirabilota bacterium]|jgi:hypothetical protein
MFLIVAISLFLFTAPAWAEDLCGQMPVGSLSRTECEFIQQKIAEQKEDAREREERNRLPFNLTSLVMDPDTFWANADDNIGRDVIVHGLSLNHVFGQGRATFGTPGGHEIMVHGIFPEVTLKLYGNNVVLRPLGTESGTNAYGASVVVPLALYMGQQ